LSAEHHGASRAAERRDHVRAENEALAACTVRLGLLDPDDDGFAGRVPFFA
jgi:hypothetical protein